MTRTTILLPDDMAARLDEERRREDTSATEIIRRALARYFRMGRPQRPRKLPFIGIGRSGRSDTARNIDKILAAEWGASIVGRR